MSETVKISSALKSTAGLVKRNTCALRSAATPPFSAVQTPPKYKAPANHSSPKALNSPFLQAGFGKLDEESNKPNRAGIPGEVGVDTSTLQRDCSNKLTT